MVQSQDNTSNEKPASFIDRVKAHTLRSAGWTYIIADGSLVAAGLCSGRYKEAITGASWGLGGLTLARYGKLDGERELAKLNKKLSEYLKNEGIELPEHGKISAETLAKKGGVIDAIEDFLYKYPSQTLNTLYSFGAFQLIASGIQHKKAFDSIAGALVATGALTGLLIPEDPGPHKRTKNPFIDTYHWIQERPLRFSGGMYMLNNAALITSALLERKHNPHDKSYMFKLLTSSIFIVANVLLTMSSKDAHTESGEHTVDEMPLYDAAAKLIATQPKDIQRDLINRVSGYLAAQDNISQDAKTINHMLTTAINRAKTTNKMPSYASWQDRMVDHSNLTPNLQI